MKNLEQIVIGPFLVLGEMLTFGHYMESLKITKQATGKPYLRIAKDFWKIDGYMSIYRGFYPYGLIQMGKGLPVLFTQSEVRYQLDKHYNDISNTNKGIISGMSAGIAQAFIYTPLQRMKTLALTDMNSKGTNTTNLLMKTIQHDGYSSLFKGLPPMMLRRSMDWGIRFGAITYLTNQIKENKGQDYKLTNFESLGVSFIGGVASSLTTPIDSWVANCQKHTQEKQLNAFETAKHMYKQNGFNAFTRGLTMRIIHSGYHTAWVAGVGSIIFNNL